MRALAWLALLSLNGCDGIQIGEGDSDGLPHDNCDRREEVVNDLSQRPQGFLQTPEVILAPAEGAYIGTLTLPSGEALPISVTFALNRQAVHAVYWGSCKSALTANVDLTIEGGTTLSGVAGGAVTTEWLGGAGELFMSATAGAESSTLMPSFESTPLEPPTLSTSTWMSYRDGVWSGQWQWSARVKHCSSIKVCTDYETVEFGNMTLSRP